MMSAEYKVGTPADIYYADTKVRGLRVPGGWSLETDWASFLSDDVVSEVRPLVVLDPDDRKQVERLMRVVRDNAFESGDSYPGMGRFADAMQAALRSQIKPPKPPEPGRYGVVVAGDGREWFRWTTSERQGQDWCRPGTDGSTVYACWDDLEVLSIKRDGVRP